MVDLRLAQLITQALEDKYFGRDKDFQQFEENDLLETSVSTLINRK